jgi:chromosome segregation protein
LDQLRETLQNDRGRLASLEALQEAALGKSAEKLNVWLKAQALDEGRRLVQNLVVEAGWERAVETVLGPYLQAVSIQSIDNVAGALSSLTDEGLTLLEDDGRPVRRGGSDDSLLALIEAPPAVTALLAGVRITQSLAAAIEGRNSLADGESFVTREGVWVGRHWLRMNRSDNPQVGVIARGDEIKRLRDRTGVTARRVEDVAKALADTRFQLERMEEDRSQAQSEGTRRQALFADTKAKLGASRGELEQARQRATTLNRAVADLDAERQTMPGNGARPACATVAFDASATALRTR